MPSEYVLMTRKLALDDMMTYLAIRGVTHTFNNLDKHLS